MAGCLKVRPKMVLFGDSLTQRSFGPGGWGAALAHQYQRRVDVVNRGMSGYNTAWALHTMQDVFFGDLDASNTALVTIFFGANDAVIPGVVPHSSRQHVPVDDYKDNLKKMVEEVQVRGVQNVVLMSPPPLFEQGYHDAGATSMDRTNANTKRYADGCKEVAHDLGLSHVDLYGQMQERKDWGDQFDDGLHFSPFGNQAVFELLLPVIEGDYPQLCADRMPMQFPAWDSINLSDPASSFVQA